jgi:(p)ppGpp synthase/HD superfamily hydrolase
VTLAAIAVERETRFAFLRRPDDSVLRAFEAEASAISDPAAHAALERAWALARGLEYHHPGQSRPVYLAHPLRVTTLYLRFFRPADAAGAATAILHNVKEVTAVDRVALASAAGEEVAAAVDLLTVDRARENDPEYKRAYYAEIESAAPYVGRIKVLDKLDNLFLLCVNPSAEVRERYLGEIEQLLLPLAARVAPQLVAYLRTLVEDCRRTGHRPLGQAA